MGQLVKVLYPYELSIFLIGNVIVAVGMMPTLALLFAMINDTAEYGEYKTGKRTVGLINSGASFGMKVGTGLGLGIIGWLLGYGGYVGGGTEQPELALQMIIAINIYIPIILSVLMILILLFFNIDKQYTKILADLKKRKENYN